MTENLEKRVDTTTQIPERVPGLPGGDTTPNYMQGYPTESNYDSTNYNGKNAIWDSGTSIIGYKNASFANSATGLQFRADTKGSSGPIGAPGNPDSTNVYLRVKRSARPYDPWYEIYHTGNLDVSKLASKTAFDNKADIAYVNSKLNTKAEYSSFDEWINNSNTSIAKKENQEDFNRRVLNKAQKSWADERLKEKIDIAYAEKSLEEFEDYYIEINTNINSLESILSSK